MPIGNKYNMPSQFKSIQFDVEIYKDNVHSIIRDCMFDGKYFLKNGNIKASGTIQLSPATTDNQAPTLGQMNTAIAAVSTRSYKVYTALLSQTGTDAPVATFLENTLGGTVVWTRFGTGVYKATLSNAFTSNKTFLLTGLKASAGATYSTILTLSSDTTSDVKLMTTLSDAARSLNDGLLTCNSVEIRVYP